MKIAIYCDSLADKSGSPRIVIDMANRLKADLITSGYDEKINEWLPINTNVIDLGNTLKKYSVPLSYYFETPLRFLFSRKLEYDLYIYYGIFSFLAAQPNKKNIWYCYSPNRLLYDLRGWKLKNASIIGKLFFSAHIFLFYWIDQFFIKKRIGTIAALSIPVKNRIKEYYSRDSEVFYYGLDVNKFKFIKLGDYYLAVSRLTIEKRMDLIAKAFTKLRNKKLILVGKGPEESKILKIIKDYDNITLISEVTEKELVNLYANCLATVYMPIEEDYGLVPLESMASGKICIAVNEGGCRNTVINGKTGYLITADEQSIIETINNLNEGKLIKMKDDCIKWAKGFDNKKCFLKWERLLSQVGKTS